MMKSWVAFVERSTVCVVLMTEAPVAPPFHCRSHRRTIAPGPPAAVGFA
jgi:hypothetical protein